MPGSRAPAVTVVVGVCVTMTLTMGGINYGLVPGSQELGGTLFGRQAPHSVVDGPAPAGPSTDPEAQPAPGDLPPAGRAPADQSEPSPSGPGSTSGAAGPGSTSEDAARRGASLQPVGSTGDPAPRAVPVPAGQQDRATVPNATDPAGQTTRPTAGQRTTVPTSIRVTAGTVTGGVSVGRNPATGGQGGNRGDDQGSLLTRPSRPADSAQKAPAPGSQESRRPSLGAGLVAPDKQGNDNQGAGNQGNGNQGNGNQGNGNQGNGNQGNGNQGNGNRGKGDQGNGNRGKGNPATGKQGNQRIGNQGKANQDSQGSGNQGNGDQGNGDQGNSTKSRAVTATAERAAAPTPGIGTRTSSPVG